MSMDIPYRSYMAKKSLSFREGEVPPHRLNLRTHRVEYRLRGTKTTTLGSNSGNEGPSGTAGVPVLWEMRDRGGGERLVRPRKTSVTRENRVGAMEASRLTLKDRIDGGEPASKDEERLECRDIVVAFGIIRFAKPSGGLR